MSKEYRTADEVVKEKYEERGWSQEIVSDTKAAVQPLSLSEKEYKLFSLLLSKLALQDKDSKLCKIYFEIQRRACYGNQYAPLDEMSETEKKMWSLGTGEIIDNSGKSMH